MEMKDYRLVHPVVKVTNMFDIILEYPSQTYKMAPAGSKTMRFLILRNLRQKNISNEEMSTSLEYCFAM